MTDAPKYGGPAFPSEYVQYKRGEVGNQVEIMAHSSGMTLRDWFAGQAIGQVIENCAGDIYVMATFPTPEAYFARKAYQVADAMLAAREASDG